MSIGEVLAAARGQAGLTITQVSQRTRIRETIIRGIEADDFSACGGDFYARGHLRAIARTIGVDGESLVRQYDSSHGSPQASAAASLPEPFAPFRLREHRKPNWSVALLVVLAALAGLIFYHVVAPGHAGSAAKPRKPAAANRAARTRPAATTTPVPSAGRAGAPAVVIVLTAVTGPCWAGLTTATGATIFQGIVAAGTSMSWTEQQAVSLRLGNPGAVTLTVNGRKRSGIGPDPVTLRLKPAKKSSG